MKVFPVISEERDEFLGGSQFNYQDQETVTKIKNLILHNNSVFNNTICHTFRSRISLTEKLRKRNLKKVRYNLLEDLLKWKRQNYPSKV